MSYDIFGCVFPIFSYGMIWIPNQLRRPVRCWQKLRQRCVVPPPERGEAKSNVEKCVDVPESSVTSRWFIIKCGHGESCINGGFNGNIIHKWGISNFYARLITGGYCLLCLFTGSSYCGLIIWVPSQWFLPWRDHVHFLLWVVMVYHFCRDTMEEASLIHQLQVSAIHSPMWKKPSRHTPVNCFGSFFLGFKDSNY